jgi:hypothetical protein
VELELVDVELAGVLGFESDFAESVFAVTVAGSLFVSGLLAVVDAEPSRESFR